LKLYSKGFQSFYLFLDQGFGKSEFGDSIYKENTLILENADIADYNDLWMYYFDLGRDYGSLKQRLAEDPILRKALEYGWGIRILNQDPWETLISFIISSNNRIPRIKRIIENLAQRFGKAIPFEDEAFYTFPQPEVLADASMEDLRACGCGYRAPYIKKTAQMVAAGIICLDEIKTLPYQQARQCLMRCMGVGPKVADCVLLFSMQKGEAFPVDVWVKRVMEALYFGVEVPVKKVQDFAAEKFGPLAGLAQQYLFYYARELKIGM
jgi:N-glycosylase/DNA lyase